MKLTNAVKKWATALSTVGYLVISGCGGGGGGGSEPQTFVAPIVQAAEPVQDPLQTPVPDPVQTPVSDAVQVLDPDPVLEPAPVPTPVPATTSPSVPAPEKIALWGDSLAASSYASIRAAVLPSREIYPGGVGAQTSTQIAARQGGVVPLLSVTDNSIPASGPVVLTARTSSPITSQGGGPITGTLAGVTGTLSRAADDSYAFTRTINGTSVFISALSPFTVNTFGRDSWINIFWMGRNNYNNQTQVKSDIASAVNFLKASPKKFIVLSILNGSYGASESLGGTGYSRIIQLNNDLAAAYPANYIDIRAYLVSNYDPAIAQDVLDFHNDLVPTSLRTDAIHLNSKGNALVAKKVSEFITANGW